LRVARVHYPHHPQAGCEVERRSDVEADPAMSARDRRTLLDKLSGLLLGLKWTCALTSNG